MAPSWTSQPVPAAATRRSGSELSPSLRRLAEQLESLHVDRARDLGWSWSQIAVELGVSKQAVHQKHGGGRAAETAAEKGR